MAGRGTVRRRIAGAIALGAAILMLILGETVLKSHLSPVGYVLFWICCLLLTGCAIVIAIMDMRTLRQETRTEHKKIVEDTFGEIERKVRERNQRN